MGIDKMLYGRTSLNNLASEMDGSPVTQQPEQYISSRPKYDPIVEEENNTPKAYQGGYTAPPSSEDLIPVRGPNRGDGLRAGSAGNHGTVSSDEQKELQRKMLEQRTMDSDTRAQREREDQEREYKRKMELEKQRAVAQAQGRPGAGEAGVE